MDFRVIIATSLSKRDSYLVMLSGLDRLQRTDPVLHLFPVLSTEDESTEWSDHLEVEGEDGCFLR